MSILFSDLDNTLIYSHHRNLGNPKIVVEHLNGREQSFMTQYTYEFLITADWLNIIPVTTRTEQQYRRIECSNEIGFKYAIICNGGKLLVDGKEDEEWSEETHIITQGNYDSLEQATDQLSNLCINEVIHNPEEYMSYVKCGNTERVYRELINLVDSTKVNVQRDGRKVYIFANGITKGNAVERFMRRKKPEAIFAAGDSVMDISMLNKADVAFAGQDIYESVETKNKIKIADRVLSDEMCKQLYKMRMKGTI